MVQVVELSHRGVSGLEHLGKDCPREDAVGLGIEDRRGGVHLIPPRPEGVAAAMGTTAQHAVEGM